MIIIIILLALVTLFILIGTFGSNDTASEKKIITSIIAVFILLFWIKALLDVVSFYARNNLGFSIEYDLKDFIFEDHWFLTSLSLGAITFLIFVLYNQISMYRRKKLLLNETDEERQLREEKETQIRQQALEKHQIYRSQQAEKQKLQTASVPSYTELKCPKCGSTNLTANNKGFGLGKAAVGGILLGPVGLLGGLVGSKKAVFICLKCGDQFQK